jgi:CRISPR-associated endonuclease Csn1
MTRILGLDLGTNSIGWSIRENDKEDRKYFLKKFKHLLVSDDDEILANEIVDYGVIVFEKGVGDGKSGEFSLAAERRKNRSKRRLYNAKRYRKWALLRLLVENKMCPLMPEELKLWSVGDWQKGKRNKGRIYPKNEEWLKWLAMDEKYFGHSGLIDKNHEGKPSYRRKSPYDLRCELIEAFEKNEELRKFKTGRALYHLAQRRGFKTSRKSGKSGYAKNEKIEKAKEENNDLQLSQFINQNYFQKNQRFRSSGVIQRKYYEEEFLAICNKQKFSESFSHKLFDAVYFVRPLRTQKGLVGKCTMEPSKPRIPISHPLFEEYRALAFINTIQWRETKSNNEFEPIPISLKKKIFEQVFFRKVSRGKNEGKIDERGYFKFEEIVDEFSEAYKHEFNYAKYDEKKLKEENVYELAANPSVSVCPVIAGLMNVFAEDWKNQFIADKDKFGINWTRLFLSYKVKYVTKKENGKGLKRKGKIFAEKKIGEERKLDYEGIWHLLFDYLQIKDKEEDLKTFCKDVLSWTDDDKIKQFCEIGIEQGYGSLSKNAISKILPYLREGNIYTEAVLYANLSKVLGVKYFSENKEYIKKEIASVIKQINKQKEIFEIVNGLIQKYFGELETIKKKGLDAVIKKQAEEDVKKKLKGFFGTTNWNKKSEEEQKEYYNFVLEKYLKFLDGKQLSEEKASFRQGKNPEIDYYLQPRLDDAIKAILKDKFNATDKGLEHLYHPSDIEIYPKSTTTKQIVDESTGEVKTVPQLESPEPPSKGWKNPMAMRTMYELKYLVNYLLRIGKIDVETKIVIEIARELNDANRRSAIQLYQKRKEEENKEFAKAILGVAKEKFPNLNENDTDNLDKVRLWWEQIENGEEIYKQIKALKEDVEKYRLWKQQECQCLYTGNMINLQDLFDGNKTQFAHTFQRSDSFDNSLANLTVADAFFNMNIQKDRIPAQLENYENEWRAPINGITYSPIKPRLQKWIEKKDILKERIENNKVETKKAKFRGDIERKNYLIRERHIMQFDFDYWNKKIKTFTLKEIPEKWKNSQIVDTQIITKYARAYMKSVFNRVDVLKARQNADDTQDGMVNIFKKIYNITNDEKKDRSRHSHHAIDAAILTLIPNSARREEMLKSYYLSLEHKTREKFSAIPYPDFNREHVVSIDQNVLINHIARNKTLVGTKKKLRKRGNVQYSIVEHLPEKFKNKEEGVDYFRIMKDGKEQFKIPKFLEGDSIKGQLHDETYFGTIKAVELNANGYSIKENGSYKIKQSEGEDEKWIVARKEIKSLSKEDFDEPNKNKNFIVDELLRQHVKKQLDEGFPLENVTDKQGKRIRHIRCRVKSGGGGYLQKAFDIRKHSHTSKYEHKKFVLAKNSTKGNFLYLLYEFINERKKPTRKARIITLFEATDDGFPGIKGIWQDRGYNQIDEIPLVKIIKVGQKAIFFTERKEELKELTKEELKKRIFVVYKFNESGTPDIYLKNNIEARPTPVIDKLCENSFNPDKYQAGLSPKVKNLNCVFEGKEGFEIKPDGEIKWKF